MANFHLFKELKRRNVLRAAVLYAGTVWALAQGIAQLGPSVGAPDWVTRWFLIAAVIGFPFWLAFAWFRHSRGWTEPSQPAIPLSRRFTKRP